MSDEVKCPICGYPALLLWDYHCTKEGCRNYDPSLLEPCPDVDEVEFIDSEDTLELVFPDEEDWNWP